MPARFGPVRLSINRGVRNHAGFAVFLVPDPAACAQHRAIDRRGATRAGKRLYQADQHAPQRANLSRQRIRERGQTTFPSPAAGIEAVDGQQGPKRVHLGGVLRDHAQEFVDGMQATHNHDYQRFQEQPIGIGGWSAARALGGWGWHRHAIDQTNQHDKQRFLSYHSGASVSSWSGNHYDAVVAAFGQVRTRPCDLCPGLI